MRREALLRRKKLQLLVIGRSTTLPELREEVSRLAVAGEGLTSFVAVHRQWQQQNGNCETEKMDTGVDDERRY